MLLLLEQSGAFASMAPPGIGGLMVRSGAALLGVWSWRCSGSLSGFLEKEEAKSARPQHHPFCFHARHDHVQRQASQSEM